MLITLPSFVPLVSCMGIWDGHPSRTRVDIDPENGAGLDCVCTLALTLEKPILPTLETVLPEDMSTAMTPIPTRSLKIELSFHTDPLIQTWAKCGPRATYSPRAAPVRPPDSFEHQNHL